MGKEQKQQEEEQRRRELAKEMKAKENGAARKSGKPGASAWVCGSCGQNHRTKDCPMTKLNMGMQLGMPIGMQAMGMGAPMPGMKMPGMQMPMMPGMFPGVKGKPKAGKVGGESDSSDSSGGSSSSRSSASSKAVLPEV